MTTWTKKQTECFISYYSEYPILYKEGDKDRSDRKTKERCLKTICEKLDFIRPNTTIGEIKNKIKTLRSQYYKEKKIVLASKKSNADSDDAYVPKLWCYELLTFLDNDTGEIRSHSNFNFPSDEQECSFSNVYETSDDTEQHNSEDVLSVNFSATPKKKQKLYQIVDETLKTANQILSNKFSNRVNSVPSDSEAKLVGQMVTIELEKLNGKNFEETKWKLLDILRAAAQNQQNIENGNFTYK